MKQYWYVVLLLILVAGGLRFTDLDKESIWLDEGYALRNAQQPTWKDFVQVVQYRDGTPPLYYAFLHFWVAAVGLDAWWLRLPSVLLSVLAVFLIFYLGRELGSPKVGLIAATLMTFSLSHIVYAQEVRPYGFFSVFILCSTISFLWVMKKKSPLPYIFSTALMLYTHNLAIFVVALHMIAYLLVYREELPVKTYLKNLAWIGLLYIPNLIVFAPHQFVHTHGFVRQAMIGKMGAPAYIANLGAFLFIILFAIGCGILYVFYRLYKKGYVDETMIEKQNLPIEKKSKDEAPVLILFQKILSTEMYCSFLNENRCKSI